MGGVDLPGWDDGTAFRSRTRRCGVVCGEGGVTHCFYGVWQLQGSYCRESGCGLFERVTRWIVAGGGLKIYGSCGETISLQVSIPRREKTLRTREKQLPQYHTRYDNTRNRFQIEIPDTRYQVPCISTALLVIYWYHNRSDAYQVRRTLYFPNGVNIFIAGNFRQGFPDHHQKWLMLWLSATCRTKIIFLML